MALFLSTLFQIRVMIQSCCGFLRVFVGKTKYRLTTRLFTKNFRANKSFTRQIILKIILRSLILQHSPKQPELYIRFFNKTAVNFFVQ